MSKEHNRVISNNDSANNNRKMDNYYSSNFQKDNYFDYDRYGVERSNHLNKYANRDDKNLNDNYVGSNLNSADYTKFESLNFNNNSNLGSSLTNANKIEKKNRASEKVKFSNINNLEFFNQKYSNK